MPASFFSRIDFVNRKAFGLHTNFVPIFPPSTSGRRMTY